MKYAIYDKYTDAYLTKMVFEVGYSEHTQFECGLNEYITKAQLLDTKKAATDAVTRIESAKFMEKGRFVVHSFDDTLNDRYIISEAGNPTKVVDNITVDLSGTINVKYGTMAAHWSTVSLDYAVNRLNRLQDASAPTRYCSWNATFDIYKVITIMDEKEHTHYQFIKVTEKGLDMQKEDDKVVSFYTRIEELEKANYELGEQVSERGAVANRLLDENKILKNTIDAIYTDLRSSDACNNLKYTLGSLEHNTDLDNISMTTKLGYIINKGHCVTAKDEACSIVENIIAIYEANDYLKNKAIKAEKAKDNQKKLNEVNVATIVRYRNERKDLDKENHELRVARDCSAEIIYAIRNAIVNGDTNVFDCIESRMRHDPDFNSDPFMAGVRENVKDICSHEKIHITNNDLLSSEIARLSGERNKALEQKEFYKRQANSVYGMTIPGRCCGKQMFYDVTTGKKILIDKKKYDDLVEYVANINLTYDTIFCMMDKPVYLSTITESINDLTK